MDPYESPHCLDTVAKSQDAFSRYPRSQRSLQVMTCRFVELLQESEEGVLDINHATKTLAVDKKRRIYDITGVLQGVGLIEKVSRSKVKWIGEASTLAARVAKLKSEVSDLEQQEIMLDQQRLWVEQSIRNTHDDYSNYLNFEDVCNCFIGHSLLAVRAPPGTQLDVPIPKANFTSPVMYQIHMKSTSGPIDVLFLNKLSDNSVPVAMPFPPSEDILSKAEAASTGTGIGTAACHTSASSGFHNKPNQIGTALMCPHTSSFTKSVSNRMDSPLLQSFSKELRNLLDPTKDIKKADIITRLVSSEGLFLLPSSSSTPSKRKYDQDEDDSEGSFGLFDFSRGVAKNIAVGT